MPFVQYDYLGLWEIDANWPKHCGKCEIHYEKRYLQGGGGEVKTDNWFDFGTPSYTQCDAGGGLNRFLLSYPSPRCSITMMLDPRSDPEDVLDGIGVTIRAHEMKHVQCNADAFSWGVDQLEKWSRKCCGDVSDKLALANKIQTAIQWKMLCCSVGVDAEDYALSTNDELRKKVETKRATARRACQAFDSVSQEISAMMTQLQ